jgi:hypothetical protein
MHSESVQVFNNGNKPRWNMSSIVFKVAVKNESMVRGDNGKERGPRGGWLQMLQKSAFVETSPIYIY